MPDRFLSLPMGPAGQHGPSVRSDPGEKWGKKREDDISAKQLIVQYKQLKQQAPKAKLFVRKMETDTW